MIDDQPRLAALSGRCPAHHSRPAGAEDDGIECFRALRHRCALDREAADRQTGKFPCKRLQAPAQGSTRQSRKRRKMKAYRIHRYGGPECASLDEAPEPELRAHDLLVRIAGVSLNPVDYKTRHGELCRSGTY